MVWGGAHFIICEADYKKVCTAPNHIIHDSIKYKIIKNNPYNLINPCCLFDKIPKLYDDFSCTLKTVCTVI